MSVAQEDVREDDIVQAVMEKPALVFSKDGSLDEFLQRYAEFARQEHIDVSTQKARKTLISAANAVTKTKTAIDAAGKALNESRRKEIDAVDAMRRKVKKHLTDLAADVRRPVTQWEEQQEARVESHKALIEWLAKEATVPIGETASDIKARIGRVRETDTSEGEMQEFSELATGKKEATLGYLKATLERVEAEEAAAKKAEADRAELEKLRKQAAEREERERQEREAREAAEREAAEAKAKQEREAAEAKAREEREARMRQEAAEQAARAAEEARLEAERKAEAEKQALIREQEEREQRRFDQERREREEAEARARDKAHREAVISAAASAIAEAGDIGDARARKIVAAICDGLVPATKVEF